MAPPRSYTHRRRRIRSSLRPHTLRVLQAVDDGDLSIREAEQLLGFLALQRAKQPALPSRATWFRRCAQLAALGLSVPPTPEPLR